MCDRDQKLRDVVELTSLLVDDRLNEAEHARLESLLFGDPEACELYLNVTTLHAHLTRDFGGTLPVKLEPEGVPAPVAHHLPAAPSRLRRPTFLTRFSRYAVAASVLLLVGVVSVLAVKAAMQPSSLACATLVELRNVAWAECSVPREAGARLEPQTIGLISGTAVIRFDSGATATMTGPAEMLIESRKSIDLKSGSILLRCEKEAAGLTVKTAASDFVDLGTEFGVAVNADASSEVHVFEGIVIARPRASDVVVPVLGNEAGRVEADRGEVISIEANASRFTGVTTTPLAPRHGALATTRSAGPLPQDARIVFLGDRATDRETHLLLINQAFARLFPQGDRPKLYNAAVSLPLSYDEAEIRRYVLSYRPTHAVIEFGPEIAAAGSPRSIAKFEADVSQLVQRLFDEGIEPIVATGFKLGNDQAQFQGLLDDYNRALRRVAATKGCRLADVDAHFRSLEKYKLSLVAPSSLPTFTGSQEMATVLMSAMGYPGIKTDPTIQLALLPGTVTQWKVRLKPADDRLDATKVTKLPVDGWHDVLLPQPSDKFCSRVPDQSHVASYRDRARGFAINLHKGTDKLVEAVSVVESSEDITMFLNTGGAIQTAWLNGQKVYDNQGKSSGMHAGAERVPVSLRAGPNTLVLEAAGGFFVSITDDYDWAVQ